MHRSRFFIVFTFIACFGSLVVVAQKPPASGYDIASLQQRAATGDAAAENQLGDLYCNGQGVAQDYVQAFAWYQKAAAQGYAAAEYDLGAAYQYGQGVTQDYAQALAWYTKAAAQGVPAAEINLGVMYEYGQGVTQDYAQAASWYTKAAAQGVAVAETNLGNLYYNGQGVTQDYAQARQWYQKAADQGDQTAKQELAKLDAPPVSTAPQVATGDNATADDADQKRQDISDKIENLQSDAEEHDNAASDWDTTAQNALDTSSCNGSALALSICRSMGEAGAAKARANADKERAAAGNDRSDIARLQGQLNSMPPNNSSPAGQNASDNSGGSGSGSSYNPDRHYSGPNSGMVQSLLDSSPGWSCPSSTSQSIKWTPPIQQVCMRDYYVTAAVAAAYGAECEARLGRDQEAELDAASMTSSVKSAKSMCSNAPVVANGGPGCSTLQIVPCP